MLEARCANGQTESGRPREPGGGAVIRELRVCIGRGYDPYFNLAVEQCLLEGTRPGQCTLYLWQNQNTVVIGRNQNAWRECRTALLEAEGGHLARRLSGGGAVFHDLGNLNFTFLVPAEDYDVARQLAVIAEACRSLGIGTETSGRNDLLADGRKFSGNAFYQSGTNHYHHGTLLVDVDTERMGRYLSPSQAKLAAKGVSSVRSRVVNLRELRRDLTIPMLREALTGAFSQVYGLPWTPVDVAELDQDALEAQCLRNASWDWIYGRSLPFSFSCQGRFPWGEIQLQFQVEEGVVQAVQVHSDAMDWRLAPALEDALAGCRFDQAALDARLAQALGQSRVCGDLRDLLAAQDL